MDTTEKKNNEQNFVEETDRQFADEKQVGSTLNTTSGRFAPGTELRITTEKSLKRKLDARFLILIVTYILNYIDRNNLAQARLRGLEEDLKLEGQEYATLLSILYVGYILAQIPSNMVLNKISRPSWYLGGAVLLWGMISVLTGITHSFVGCLLTRFFLGFIEAAFLPGALLILSRWYTPRELTFRYTLLYCGNLISNAFGSMIAAGILANMEGVLGHRAWRWLFYVEGAITMLCAVGLVVILPDYPTSKDRGLTEDERTVAQLRMTENLGDEAKAEEDLPMTAGLVMTLKDPKIYCLTFSLTACVVGLSFNAYFPTLTATLGYPRTQTLLLVAPPWVLSCLIALVNSYHSDLTGEKFWHSVWPLGLGVIGFCVALGTEPDNIAGRYVSLFLQASAYPGFITMYSWLSVSIPGTSKRAVALAFMNAFSQLGNIAGSYVWDKRFGPSYRVSYIIVLVMFCCTVVLNFGYRFILIRLNRRLDAAADAVANNEENAEAVTKLKDEEIVLMKQGYRYLI